MTPCKTCLRCLLIVILLLGTSCDLKKKNTDQSTQKAASVEEKQPSAEKQRLIEKLVHAAKRGDKENVMAALDAGADINGLNNNDMTALMEASVNGHINIVRLLIEKGANIRIENKAGQQAIRFATVFDHADIVKLYLEKGENVSDITYRNGYLLFSSAYHKTPELLNLLLKHGLKVDRYFREDYKDKSALHPAAGRCRLETIKILLREGALINIHDKFDGNTPLISAAKGSCLKAIILLVENGAEVNAVNRNGYTALIYSAFHGDADAVSYLLENKANASIANKYGETALDRAIEQKKIIPKMADAYTKIITLLKEHGQKKSN